MKQSSLQRLVLVAAVCMMIATIPFVFFVFRQSESRLAEIVSEQMVNLNRMENGNEIERAEASADMKQLLGETQGLSERESEGSFILMLYIIVILFILCITAYLYFSILHPFTTLQKYAAEIARGNFNLTLDYERQNYFGQFTWAFDHMRKEIIKARNAEQEAIENNKTVIATLSHDIKTPIASIRGYCEALEANLGDPERKRQYVATIYKKCDEVAQLTNDLFMHSLADLKKLKVNQEKIEIAAFLENIHLDMNAENQVFVAGIMEKAMVLTDSKRLEQAIGNIFNNAAKYAKTKVEMFTIAGENEYEIHIRDFGKGIPDEDMPFIVDKFYRGKNARQEQGAGLGLFIVKYVMEQTGGKLSLLNSSAGLEVILWLPYAEEKI